MLIRGWRAALVLALSLSVVGISAGQSTQTRDAALRKAIQARMKGASIPGVTVGIWQDGRAPFIYHYGVRDVETQRPMSGGLFVRIGSITKSFVGTLLLQLAAEKRLNLDDPISKYVSDVPNGDRVTLRMLASMRSGVFSYSNIVLPNVVNDPYRQWTPQELIDIAIKHKPVFEPGAEFDYSNTNTVLLGVAIEKATGKKLEDLIERRLIQRLKMKHTLFPKSSPLPTPHASGYADFDGFTYDTTNWNPSWGWAAGQMISSFEDIYTWTRSLVRGDLITPAMKKERNKFKPAPDEGVGSKYGIGIEDQNGWIGHNGNVVGYITYAYGLPSKGLTMVVVFNSSASVLTCHQFLTDLTKIISPKNQWPALPKLDMNLPGMK